MMNRLTFVILLCAVVPSAFARVPGEEPVHPDYQSPFDVVGLCTASRGNDKNHYFQSGHCQTIWESLTKDGEKPNCIKKMIEQVRLRVLDDEKSRRTLIVQGVKEPKSMNLGFSCNDKNGSDEGTLEKAAKDQTKFNLIMMQFFSAIAIQESKWRVNEGGSAKNSQEVKCETHCGLFGLNKADMEKPEYACGCEIPNKTDDQKQYDPTMDGHLNLRCGMTMALTEALKDKESTDLFDSSTPIPGKPKPKISGMAKIFKSLQKQAKDDEPDTNPRKYDTPLRKIAGKMQSYCETEAYGSRANKETIDKVQKNDGLNAIGMPTTTTH